MQDEDKTSILNAKWPKDTTSGHFIRKLRLHIERDIALAHLYFPQDIAQRANWLLQQFPVDQTYLKSVIESDDEHSIKPNTIIFDLGSELDVSKLTQDPSRYRLDLGGYSRASGRLVVDYHAKVHIKQENGVWSELLLPVYRDHYLHTLKRETFSSSDLLDQLLVLLVIKGAQSGNKACRDRLFGLFQVAARGVAHRFVNKWLREMNLRPSETGALAKHSVNSVADTILLILIQGDPLKTLLELAKDKQDVTIQLNRKLQHMLLEEVSKLPHRLAVFEAGAYKRERKAANRNKRLMKQLSNYPEATTLRAWQAMWPFIEGFIARGKNSSFEDIVKQNELNETEAEVAKLISDWFVEDRQDENAKGSHGLYMTTMLNPFIMITAHPNFNSTLYRPNKKTPFPVWLFGNDKAKNLGQQGAFQRKLNDWFKSLCHQRKDKATGKRILRLKPEHYVGGTAQYTEGLRSPEELFFKAKGEQLATLQPEAIEVLMDLAGNLYRENKISARDREIVLYYHLRRNYHKGLGIKITKKTLGEKYGISERQVSRILAHFQTLARQR